jgi:hypothetical protein
MRGMGLDVGMRPTSGTYRVGGGRVVARDVGGEEEEEEVCPPTKRHKSSTDGGAMSDDNAPPSPSPLPPPAFNASESCDNAVDLICEGTSIPLAPRDARILLLDIEGTTTSISFVKDVLFPYVLANLDEHVDAMDRMDLVGLENALKTDVSALEDGHPAKVDFDDLTPHLLVKSMVRTLMAHDVKATVSMLRTSPLCGRGQYP